MVKKHKQGHYHINSSSIITDTAFQIFVCFVGLLFFFVLKRWGLLKALPNPTAQSRKSQKRDLTKGKRATKAPGRSRRSPARREAALDSHGSLTQVRQLGEARCLTATSHL